MPLGSIAAWLRDNGFVQLLDVTHHQAAAFLSLLCREMLDQTLHDFVIAFILQRISRVELPRLYNRFGDALGNLWLDSHRSSLVVWVGDAREVLVCLLQGVEMSELACGFVSVPDERLLLVRICYSFWACTRRQTERGAAIGTDLSRSGTRFTLNSLSLRDCSGA